MDHYIVYLYCPLLLVYFHFLGVYFLSLKLLEISSKPHLRLEDTLDFVSVTFVLFFGLDLYLKKRFKLTVFIHNFW